MHRHRGSPGTSRASWAAWWRTNRARHWRRARCCRPAAPRRTRRWRSASCSASRCRRGRVWAAAAPAWPMPPTRSRPTAACRRRCCSPRSHLPCSANADRPAAVPMLPRGLYLLHARYGSLPFERLIVPAEQLARFGTPAPRALVRDIALVAGPLLADPNARAVFSQDGTPLAEGPDAASSPTWRRHCRRSGSPASATSTPACWRAGSCRPRRWPAGRSRWRI